MKLTVQLKEALLKKSMKRVLQNKPHVLFYPG